MKVYTDGEIDYIITNAGNMRNVDMARCLGVSPASLTVKLCNMRKAGIISKNGRAPNFTKAEDKYILSHRGYKTSAQIGLAIGRTAEQVEGRVKNLKKLDPTIQSIRTESCIEPQVITDGYPTVPWHMRQSTRSQRLTLDWESDKVE